MASTIYQESVLPLLAVLLPIAAIPPILMSSRRPNLRECWTLLAAIGLFGCVCALVPGALRGETSGIRLFDIAPGVPLHLVADPLGIVFALVASGLWILTSVYSIGYMRGHGEANQTRYFAAFSLCLAATIGVAFAKNLLTFLLFYEVLTLATYPLVAHRESKEAVRAGRMYLAYALTGGLLFLAAASWIYFRTGVLGFEAGGMLPSDAFSAGELKALFLLFLAGVGVKAGIMPLHGWLPAAMIAPTPVSALLHAVAVVKAGAFGVLRICGFVLGPDTMMAHGLDTILAVFAGATVMLASLIAMRQDNLKKRLAYSTISHLSYIVFGAALLSPSALQGGILHLAAHALMKITLFFCAGAIAVHAHKKAVSELNGLGRSMPWTFGAFTIASIGLAGLPPINGFVSKWWLCVGSMEAGSEWALAIFLASGVLNAGYLFPIIVRGFFRPAPPEGEAHGHMSKGEASPWMVIPPCATAALALIFGIFPTFPLPLFDLAHQASQAVFSSGN